MFVSLVGIVGAVCAMAQAPLRIAAEADLQPVLTPVLAGFEQATGIHAKATYQASAELATQIEKGAPVDVFLAEDRRYPQRLIDAGLADAAGSPDSSTAIIYAKGTLVLWVRKGSKLGAPALETLKNPLLKRLAIANPPASAYGRAAIAALERLGVFDTLQTKLVTPQAAQFEDLANEDAALISLALASTARMSASGTYFVIPRTLYPPIEFGAVIVSKTAQRDNVHKFLDYLLSPVVQAQLEKSGLMRAR